MLEYGDDTPRRRSSSSRGDASGTDVGAAGATATWRVHMTTESQITAWLATQQDAMVALLREMVDIDSGSYNKPGIDAVGAVVQRFLAATASRWRRCRQQKHGDCLRAAVPWDGPAGQRRRQHRADGPSRHGVPRRRGGAPAVHHPRRRRLRPGRRRHEGRAGDELLRARRLRASSAARRRRWSGCSPATRRSAARKAAR